MRVHGGKFTCDIAAIAANAGDSSARGHDGRATPPVDDGGWP